MFRFIKKYSIYIFLSLFQLLIVSNTTLLAESEKIDSLLKVLKNVRDKDKAVIYNVISKSYYELSQPETSLEYADKALEAAEENNQKKEIANAYLNMAFVYFGQKEYEKAIEFNNKIIEMTEDKEKSVPLMKAYDNLSVINYYKQNFEKVYDYAKKANEIAIEIDDKKYQAESYNHIGLYYYVKGMLKKTAEFWEKELALRKEIGSEKRTIASTYNNIGVIYKRRGDYQKAIKYYQENLKLNQEMDDTMGMAMSLSNIGNIYYNFGIDYDKALEFYSDAISYFSKEKDTFNIVSSLLNIGYVYKIKDSLDKAEEYFDESLKLSMQIDKKGDMAMALNGLSMIYLERGKNKKALEYSYEALEYFKESGDKNNIASAQNTIGDCYMKLGNYQQALEYFNKCLVIYKEMGMNKEMSDVYKNISKAYRKMGSYQKALNFYMKYSERKDSTLSEEYMKTIEDMQAKYESDKKDLQLKQMEEKDRLNNKIIRQQRWLLLAGTFVLLVTIGFSILVIRQNNKIKRVNLLLEEQNVEIKNQRDQIFHQKQEIEDSIHYASRIQTAILPPKESIEKMLPEHFILFKPRDIVSGDFYWINRRGDKTVFTAADCTGHGVPGAFMSMLGTAFLNEVVSKHDDVVASQILNDLRENVVSSLHQTGKSGESKDGMDIALCVFDHKNYNLQFSGAYNPLFLIRKGELTEYKADKMPIGIFHEKDNEFTHHDIKLQKGDTLYIFSDGYVDQFGGEKKRKFMKKRFKDMLLEIQDKSMQEQKTFLDETIENWRGDMDQIDDIIVMGVRV